MNNESRLNFFHKLFRCLGSKAFFVFGFFIFCFLLSVSARAATPQELKEAISQKSAELRQLDTERQVIIDNLNKLDKENQGIQKDIKKNDYQINQLNLSIKSSGISIEKLGLEIESLNNEIQDIEAKSETEKLAVASLLRQLNEEQKESILVIFLKNKSLVDSVSETQRLVDLNTGLTAKALVLKQLHEERSEKLGEISDKKDEQELNKANLEYRKVIVQDQKSERQSLLKANKTQEKVYQQRIDELERMQAEIGAEIDKIESELRKQIDPTILPTARPGVLAMPVSVELKTNLTQSYGSTAFAKGIYVNDFHNGIDIGVPVGTPVFAAENGRVLAIGNTDKYCPPVWYGRKKYGGSYGKYIVIKHENNLSTSYSHLSLQVVKVGDIVNRGDLIGYTGNTGFSTGPHLHFSVYANIYGANEILLSPEIKSSNTCGLQPYGATLNPIDYL